MVRDKNRVSERVHLVELLGNKCAVCNSYGGNLEVHHVIPLYKQGMDSAENLVLLCHKCHVMAHNGKQEINDLPTNVLLNLSKSQTEKLNRVRDCIGACSLKETVVWIVDNFGKPKIKERV